MTLIEHFLNQGGTTDKAKITFRVGTGECERGELPVFYSRYSASSIGDLDYIQSIQKSLPDKSQINGDGCIFWSTQMKCMDVQSETDSQGNKRQKPLPKYLQFELSEQPLGIVIDTVDGISTGEDGYPAFVGKNLHLEHDKLYTAYASVCIYKFPSRDGFWFGFSLDDIERSIK